MDNFLNWQAWLPSITGAFTAVSGLAIVTLIGRTPVLGTALVWIIKILGGTIYAMVLGLQGLMSTPGGRKVVMCAVFAVIALGIRHHYIEQGRAEVRAQIPHIVKSAPAKYCTASNRKR